MRLSTSGVNGTQVGYAEDSFTADTFDVTDYIRYAKKTRWRSRSTAGATAHGWKIRIISI